MTADGKIVEVQGTAEDGRLISTTDDDGLATQGLRIWLRRKTKPLMAAAMKDKGWAHDSTPS